MSFDIFLECFEPVEPAEAAKAPVLQVLRSLEHSGPDQFGFYNVVLPDGVSVEFSAKNLDSEHPFSGCAFHVRAFSDQLIDFIFKVAHAGKMAILPAMADGLIVVVHEEITRRIPAGVLEKFKLVEIDSPAELKVVLAAGFDGWSEFRGQVIR